MVAASTLSGTELHMTERSLNSRESRDKGEENSGVC